MPTPLQGLIDLVAANGMEHAQAATIANYVADRCAGLSLPTVHSSAHSALHRDEFLVTTLGLSRRQIRAWLALVRGTRAVRRHDGRVVGGCPGFIEATMTGSLDAERTRRFQRLARLAALKERSAPAGSSVSAPGRISQVR